MLNLLAVMIESPPHTRGLGIFPSCPPTYCESSEVDREGILSLGSGVPLFIPWTSLPRPVAKAEVWAYPGATISSPSRMSAREALLGKPSAPGFHGIGACQN